MVVRLGLDPRNLDPSFIDEWRERAEEVEAREVAEERRRAVEKQLNMSILETQFRHGNILMLTAVVGLLTLLLKR